MTVHGLLFLGGGYALSYSDPGFAILHSGLGILVYTIFFFTIYPQHARSAAIGAVLSVAAGLFFGDFVMDSLYSGIDLTIYHRIYAAMLTMYIYLYLDVAYNCIKDVIQKKETNVLERLQKKPADKSH